MNVPPHLMPLLIASGQIRGVQGDAAAEPCCSGCAQGRGCEASTAGLVGAVAEKLGKAQWIRALDVFVFGPLMIAGALSLPKGSGGLRVALAAVGVGTVAYNGYNWVRVNREGEKAATAGNG